MIITKAAIAQAEMYADYFFALEIAVEAVEILERFGNPEAARLRAALPTTLSPWYESPDESPDPTGAAGVIGMIGLAMTPIEPKDVPVSKQDVEELRSVVAGHERALQFLTVGLEDIRLRYSDVLELLSREKLASLPPASPIPS
jgi:hypothetical protein